MKKHMKFYNMGTDIRGNYEQKSGFTFFPKKELEKAIINISGNVIFITINGHVHAVKYDNELLDFIYNLNGINENDRD